MSDRQRCMAAAVKIINCGWIMITLKYDYRTKYDTVDGLPEDYMTEL